MNSSRLRSAAFALAALCSLAPAAPSSAGTLYVPVLDENGVGGVQRLTDLLIANTGSSFADYQVAGLQVDTDGTVRTVPPVPGSLHKGKSARLASVGAPGSAGLLEITAPVHIAVSARLSTVSADHERITESVVPVLSSDNALAAGAVARLLGLYREPGSGEASDFTVVNLARQGASCTVKTFRADGVQVATTGAVLLKPLSMRAFSDVLALLGETAVDNGRMDVSCDKPFYAFATITRRDRGETQWVTPAATGASTLGNPGGGPPAPPPPAGSIVFRADGPVHTATSGNPKGILRVPVERELRLRRLVLDLDFTPGPWNTSKDPGNHNIVWLHRGKFRSNTIGNINAFGPSKFSFKVAQNIDLPAHASTGGETGIQLSQGVRSHLRYTYNADLRTVTAEVTRDGVVLATLAMEATAIGGTLTVPATGLVVEFGHLPTAEGPEVPAPGWSYSNLRIEMVPY